MTTPRSGRSLEASSGTTRSAASHAPIPIAVQFLQGGYGSRDMGAMMAMLVLAIIPIIAFYFSSQRYIIEDVVAGAVKG
jgi:raffinose/stachyose/melibiose transport system permease protein